MYALIPQVVSTVPAPNARNILAAIEIKVTFNCDLKVDSTPNSMTVHRLLSQPGQPESLIVDRVNGTISYKDRVLTFKPTENFAGGTSYQVTIISDVDSGIGIRSIIGNYMPAPHTFSFTTATTQVAKVSLVSPAHQSIVGPSPILAWNNTNDAKYYQIQVSRSNTFNIIYWTYPMINNLTSSPIRPDTHYDSEKHFNEEGIFYWRMRGYNWEGQPGPFSDVFQFTIDFAKRAPIVIEDTVKEDPFDGEYPPEIQIPLEVLETFPVNHASGLNTRLRTTYMIVEGDIDIQTLHRDSLRFTKESLIGDGDIEEVPGVFQLQKLLDGRTIISFTPDEIVLEDEEE